MPRLNSVDAVIERLGIGRAMVFRLLASGELRSVKLGKRRLIPEQAIVDFIAALEAAGGGS